MKTLDGYEGKTRRTRDFASLRISRSQEEAMIRSIEACNDPQEKNRLAWKLCEANYGLVMKQAYRFRSRSPETDVDDMFMSGLVELHKAAMRFRSDRNTVFSTYATYYVRSGIRKAIGIAVKAGSKPRPKTYSMNGSEFREEIAVAIGNRSTIVEDETMINISNTKQFAQLPTRHRNIMSMWCGLGCEPKNFQQIGDHLGISRQRVHQIYTKSVEQLRDTVRAESL